MNPGLYLLPNICFLHWTQLMCSNVISYKSTISKTLTLYNFWYHMHKNKIGETRDLPWSDTIIPMGFICQINGSLQERKYNYKPWMSIYAGHMVKGISMLHHSINQYTYKTLKPNENYSSYLYELQEVIYTCLLNLSVSVSHTPFPIVIAQLTPLHHLL